VHAFFLYSLEKGNSFQLTDGLSDAISPAFDAGGKDLYFLASTNFALNTGWLDMSSFERPFTRGVYLIVLSAEDESPILPESDEEEAEQDEMDMKDSTDKKQGKKEEGKRGRKKIKTKKRKKTSPCASILMGSTNES
jgi:tricorn protease